MYDPVILKLQEYGKFFGSLHDAMSSMSHANREYCTSSQTRSSLFFDGVIA